MGVKGAINDDRDFSAAGDCGDRASIFDDLGFGDLVIVWGLKCWNCAPLDDDRGCLLWAS
jgi:hypothetical protein